jgi:hypothetical protein
MKKSFLLSTLLALASSAFAQAPEKLSYQAVVRDIGGTLLTQEVIGMRLSILQGSEAGPAVYVERQSPSSNENGLVSLEIGAGEFISGNFSEIDWADGPYYLKREIDPTGGFLYTITGTAELLSVPYALYSKRTQVHADGAYNLNYYWPGEISTGGDGVTLLSTAINWLGDRVIMVSGTINLEFHIPQVAIDNGIGGGTADLDMYLLYGSQVINVINFRGIQIEDEAQVTLPISALIPNSVAGSSMQFTVGGNGNSSQTFIVASPGQTYGPYPIDVSVSTVLHVVEL